MTGFDVFGKPAGMLKRVHDANSRVSITGYGVSRREELTVLVSSVNNAETVTQVATSGAPSHCHPELVSGSGFDPL